MTRDVNKPEDLVELKNKYGFALKPVAKLNISVQLPQLSTGKSISTTSVMEKINKRAKVQFKSLKITKTTIDFLRLEGELDSMKQLDVVEQRLNRVKIKLDGFDEQLKLKANKVKIGPFKHDWETFFRDNPQMDEMKPGYRPDTIVIENLPLKWFSNNDALKTNWLISVFSAYGDIRRFHIPLLDEIEKEKQLAENKKSNDPAMSFRKFNFNSDSATFDVYLMYKDYVGFVNAMDGLRGMKLVKCFKNSDNQIEFIEHDIKLNFDRTKHLSDKAIRRRQIAKKYGINTLEDLNEYKKKAKERKLLFEQRTEELKKQRKSSKNLLNYLARLVEVDQKQREIDEQKALNERLLKERLIEEEKKLRNKLIERQRTLQREKEQESASLKKMVRSYDKSRYANSDRDSDNYSNHKTYNDHIPSSDAQITSEYFEKHNVDRFYSESSYRNHHSNYSYSNRSLPQNSHFDSSYRSEHHKERKTIDSVSRKLDSATNHKEFNSSYHYSNHNSFHQKQTSVSRSPYDKSKSGLTSYQYHDVHSRSGYHNESYSRSNSANERKLYNERQQKFDPDVNSQYESRSNDRYGNRSVNYDKERQNNKSYHRQHDQFHNNERFNYSGETFDSYDKSNKLGYENEEHKKGLKSLVVLPKR